jgi:peptide/nickel transport system permease protein
VNLLIGVILGTLSALYKDRLLDRLIRRLMLVIYSMPGFWLSLMLILLISLRLDLLPASQISSPNADLLSWPEQILDILRHMILPVFVLGVGSATATGRYMRASMLDVIGQDYIRTARAKGLSEFRVFGKHAMRNAIIPIITISGLSLPALLSGAVIVETVFSWHGMGYLTIEAIFSRDYPLIIATTFIAGVMVIVGNLLADVSYALVDPRIRTGNSAR